jgi:hypothetical protein
MEEIKIKEKEKQSSIRLSQYELIRRIVNSLFVGDSCEQ